MFPSSASSGLLDDWLDSRWSCFWDWDVGLLSTCSTLPGVDPCSHDLIVTDVQDLLGTPETSFLSSSTYSDHRLIPSSASHHSLVGTSSSELRSNSDWAVPPSTAWRNCSGCAVNRAPFYYTSGIQKVFYTFSLSWTSSSWEPISCGDLKFSWKMSLRDCEEGVPVTARIDLLDSSHTQWGNLQLICPSLESSILLSLTLNFANHHQD